MSSNMAYPDPEITQENDFAALLNGNADLLHFQALPAYATFLLENKVEEMAQRQLDLVRKYRLPLLTYFEDLPEDELIRRGVLGFQDMLKYLSKNQAKEFVDKSMHHWLSNQIPLITKDQVKPEDITRISFIRRKIFRDLLSAYPVSTREQLVAMEELDRISAELDANTMTHLFQLHQDLFNQAQSIAQLGNWIMDIKTRKISWSDELYNIYELIPGTEIPANLASYNHPEDKQRVSEKIEQAIKDCEPFDFHYRIIAESGNLEYLPHAKGAVHLGDDGLPQSLIGTLQDVTVEKQIENELASSQTFMRSQISPLRSSPHIMFRPANTFL